MLLQSATLSIRNFTLVEQGQTQDRHIKVEPGSCDMMTGNGEQNHVKVELEAELLPVVKVEIPVQEQFSPSDEEFEDENDPFHDEDDKGWDSVIIKEECLDNSDLFTSHQSEFSDSGNDTSTILHESQFICVENTSEKCPKDLYTKSSVFSRVNHENSISLNPVEIKNKCNSPVQAQGIKQECSNNDSLTWHEASDQSCTEYKVLSDVSDISIRETLSQPNGFFEEKQLSSKQVQNNSEQKVYRCDICSSVFKSNQSLLWHTNGHAGIRPYECKLCSKRFSRPFGLSEHLKSHSDKRCYKCKYCDKAFKTHATLTKHMQYVHEGRRSYRCEECNVGFRYKHGLTRHQQVYHMKRGSVCEICHKEFATNGSLIRHKRNHTGENQFPCQFCNKVLHSKQTLTYHERLHTGYKPFACPAPGCGQAFIQKRVWLLHMMRYHPVDKLEKRT